MEFLHYRESGNKSFQCCEQNVEFYDSVSCNDSRESCIVICDSCKTKYFQEIIFGRQYDKIGGSITGYPHYNTFTLPRNL